MLPLHYSPVGLHCVLPSDEATGDIGLGLSEVQLNGVTRTIMRDDMPVLRLRLTLNDAARLLSSLQANQRVVAACQSLTSSGLALPETAAAGEGAKAIGISSQAVSQWPDVLSRSIEDRVLAAMWRKKGDAQPVPAPIPHLPPATHQEATHG